MLSAGEEAPRVETPLKKLIVNTLMFISIWSFCLLFYFTICPNCCDLEGGPLRTKKRMQISELQRMKIHINDPQFWQRYCILSFFGGGGGGLDGFFYKVLFAMKSTNNQSSSPPDILWDILLVMMPKVDTCNKFRKKKILPQTLVKDQLEQMWEGLQMSNVSGGFCQITLLTYSSVICICYIMTSWWTMCSRKLDYQCYVHRILSHTCVFSLQKKADRIN